jgi:hypothetical protein
MGSQTGSPEIILAGEADGELDAFGGVLAGGDVEGELVAREELLEEIAELDLAPGAARLDVGQDALEVADAAGERAHLAQAGVDLLQALADQGERFAEPALQRPLKFFIDGLAHLVEALGVVFLEVAQAGVDGVADLVEALLVALGQGGELALERAAEGQDGAAELLAQLAGVDA